MRKLASFLWWSYPRGSIEYDVMVGLILAFIFLTPPSFFRDQPRPGTPAGSNFSLDWHLVPPAAAAALPQAPSAAPADLAGVIHALDTAAPTIKRITANTNESEFHSALNETEKLGNSRFYFDKNDGKPRAAYVTGNPPTKIDMLVGGWGWDVSPPLDQCQKLKVSAHQAAVNAVLQLGFGGSGAQLASDYEASYGGVETLDGAGTVKLALVPKDPDVLKMFPRIDLWLDTSLWVARQQQFWNGPKDYSTRRYSDLHLNTAIPSSVFSTDAFKHCTTNG